MKYLHLNEIPWQRYSVIGFDMDGTLYSEELFVNQAYEVISQYLATYSCKTPDEIYNWMINRWRVKGSSYPFIFSEAMEQFHIVNDKKKIEECLHIYRSTELDLFLNHKIENVLDQLLGSKEVFLVSDGHYELQQRKFSSLKLNRWFLIENVVFTGKWGSKYYKPNVESTRYISCLQNKKSSVLYFGDREMDEKFAQNAGFDFVKVEQFNDFWEVSK